MTIRRNGLILPFMACAATAATPADAKDPLHLQPSSKWHIHYADDSCRMMRTFGEGDQMVRFVADRFQPGDALRLSIIGKPIRTYFDNDASIRFGPVGIGEKVAFFAATADKVPALYMRNDIRLVPLTKAQRQAAEAAGKSGNRGFQFPSVSPAEEEAITFLEIARRGSKTIRLETGSLGAPMKKLRECTDELLDHWGIDVAKHMALSRPAIPVRNPARWITSNQYPAGMLALGKRAVVQFRLNIDTAGVPTACHIQQSTRPKDFDDAVCKTIMRNAKFHPALDADGRPLASYWLNSVAFVM